MYDGITSVFGADMDLHIPVVLTPDIVVLNGYYSSTPYNKIVLYDTPAAEGTLACFDNTILSVFYHELTHAVSANIRSPFSRFFSVFVGDIISPVMMVNMPPVFMEGAAVAMESSEKPWFLENAPGRISSGTNTEPGNESVSGGRLHDPLFYQALIQARIEDAFPTWTKACGARDTWGAGSLPYVYGGAFLTFMQKKYNREQYAALWNQAGKISVRGYPVNNFPASFGVSLAAAWKQFEYSVSVPPVIEINEQYVPQNGRAQNGGGFSSVAAGEQGIAWLDTAASGVFFITPDVSSAEGEKLFSCTVQSGRLSFSRSGRYLMLSGAYPGNAGYSWNVRIFDMEERRFTGYSVSGIRDASFVVLADGREVIAGVETRSQSASLVLLDPGRMSEGAGVYETDRFSFDLGIIPFSPVDAGNGKIAYLESRGLDRRIMLYDPLNGVKEELVFAGEKPQAIRYLNSTFDSVSGQTRLFFGWSRMDTLYRLGIIDPVSETVFLQDNDISGGIHIPAVRNGICYYAASFTESSRLMYKALNTFACTESSVAAQSAAVHASFGQSAEHGEFISVPSDDSQSPPGIPPASAYNPLSYMFRGVFIPFVMPTYASRRADILPDFLVPGFFWFTGDPAEQWSIQTSLFFNTDLLFLDTNIQLESTALPVSFALAYRDTLNTAASFENDRIIQRKTAVSLKSLFSVPLKDFPGRWYFENSMYVNLYWKPFALSENRTGAALYSLPLEDVQPLLVSAIRFSSVRRTGTGHFDRSGIEPQLLGLWILPGSGIAEFSANFVLDGLLPVENTRTYTFSLPLSVRLSAAYAFGSGAALSPAGAGGVLSNALPVSSGFYDPVYGRIRGTSVIGGRLNMVLFSMEIQNGPPALIYFNRLIISAGYGGYYYGGNPFAAGAYLDDVSFGVTLVVSPIIGAATGTHFEIGLKALWLPRSGNAYLTIAGLYTLPL